MVLSEKQRLRNMQQATWPMKSFTIDPEFQALIPPLGEEERRMLEESIRRDGIRDELRFWRPGHMGPPESGILLDGHNRYEIGQRLNLKTFPACEVLLPDRAAALVWILENQLGRRNLTDDQRAALAANLLERRTQQARKEKASKGGRTGGRGRGKDSPEVNSTPKLSEPKSRLREEVAAEAKVSEQKLRDAAELKKTDPELHQKVAAGEMTLREARKEAAGKVELPTVHTERPKDWITLAEWQALSVAERRRTIVEAAGESNFNPQDGDSIEWAKWSWNPVTGCLHDCPYCYARDMANRLFRQKFEPSFLPCRLGAPQRVKVPVEAQTDVSRKNVFTCSMADLFGRWVPKEWIDAVLAEVRAAPQWNFLFLTKFPIRLAEFDFPDNAWVGTTVDCQIRVANAERAFRKVKAKVKWLSCEPLIEPLRFTALDMFQWVVIGGSSASTKTPEWHPPREWSESLRKAAKKAGCQVYEKTNLLQRFRDYPGCIQPEATVAPDTLRYLPSVET